MTSTEPDGDVTPALGAALTDCKRPEDHAKNEEQAA